MYSLQTINVQRGFPAGRLWVCTALVAMIVGSPSAAAPSPTAGDPAALQPLYDALVDHAGPALVGHAGRIEAADFSPDGRRVVTGSRDGTARLWDAATGRLIAILVAPAGGRTHYDQVYFVTWSASGRTIARVRFTDPPRRFIVDLFDGRDGLRRGVSLEHDQAVLDVGFDRDDARVIVATTDGIRLWDARTGARLPGPELVHEGLSEALIAPSGETIWTVSGERSALRRTADFEPLVEDPCPVGRAMPVFTDDGRLFACPAHVSAVTERIPSGMYFALRIFDAVDGTRRHQIPIAEPQIAALPGGHVFAVADGGLIDGDSGAWPSGPDEEHADSVLPLRLTMLLDSPMPWSLVAQHRFAGRREASTAWVTRAALSARGGRGLIVRHPNERDTHDGGRIAELWSAHAPQPVVAVDTGAAVRSLNPTAGVRPALRIRSVTLSPDGRAVAAALSRHGRMLAVWSLDDGRLRSITDRGSGYPPNRLRFGPESRWVYDRNGDAVDSAQPAPPVVERHIRPPCVVDRAAFEAASGGRRGRGSKPLIAEHTTPDGRTAAFGYAPTERWWIDCASGLPARIDPAAQTARFDPAGRHLVVLLRNEGEAAPVARLFRVADRTMVAEIVHPEPIDWSARGARRFLVVGPDGRYAVTRSGSRALLLDFVRGRAVDLGALSQRWPDARFSADGRRVLVNRPFSAGDAVFETATGAPIRELPPKADYTVLSPDGRWLAIAHDEALRIVRVDHEDVGLRMRPFPKPIKGLRFTADGRRLVIWGAALPDLVSLPFPPDRAAFEAALCARQRAWLGRPDAACEAIR